MHNMLTNCDRPRKANVLRRGAHVDLVSALCHHERLFLHVPIRDVSVRERVGKRRPDVGTALLLKVAEHLCARNVCACVCVCVQGRSERGWGSSNNRKERRDAARVPRVRTLTGTPASLEALG